MKNGILLIFVVVIGYGAYILPGAWRTDRATSFVKFAKDGVKVSPVENGRMAGTGDPIGVPGGVGLMMGAEFEFTNSAGEKRRASFCNGHPDYIKIVDATPSQFGASVYEREGHKLKFRSAINELDDPHTVNSWWVRHMGFERLLRVVTAE